MPRWILVLAVLFSCAAFGCRAQVPQPTPPERSAAVGEEQVTIRDSDRTALPVEDPVISPFVRRVSTPLFARFVTSLKAALSSAVAPATVVTEVKGSMDAEGRLIGCRLIQDSPPDSVPAGRLLLQACQDTLRDPHPPPAAIAEDGRIHLIFRMSVETHQTPRGPAFGIERAAGLL